MLPPRPSLKQNDAANMDRITKAHAAMAGAPAGAEAGEDPAIGEIESGLQQATAGLAKLKGAEQAESAAPGAPAEESEIP